MFGFGLDTTKVYTTEDFDLGTMFFDRSGKGYMFIRANGALDTVGDVVGIDEAWDATPVTTTTSAPGTGQGLPCGVVLAALADNEYGWVQVFGFCAAINVGSSCAVHTELNSTATGGRIDDDATAGAEVIRGITTTGAESSNSATGVINFPTIGRTL